MYYEVWIDVLFIVNVWVNFLLLRLVNHMLGGTATPQKSIVGACMGALLICLLACFPQSPIINTLLIHVAGSTIMVRFGCNLRKIKKVYAGVLLLYGSAFLMGGFLEFIQRYIGPIYIEEILFWGIVGYLILFVCMQMHLKYITKQENIYKVWLYANGKCQQGTAFLDTGNHLRDPLSGKPVCIVEITMLEELCSAKTMEHLRHFQDELEFEEEMIKLRPHYVPFKSLGCLDGIALAVTVDFLYLENQRIQKVITQPVLAFLSENSSFSGNYQMILHPNLIDS